MIIMLSLVVGFVCSNILISFLIFETNTDKFHSNAEKTFQVFSNDPFGGKRLIPYIPSSFRDYLADTYAEVENVCQISNLDGVIIKTSDNRFDNFRVLSVDSSFFTLFDFPLLQGRKDKCLTPDKIVLSKDKAWTLFGNSDVVGNLLTVTTPDTTRDLIISAVVDRIIENSHLTFDVLVHHSTFADKRNGGGATYALLTSADARESLVNKINHDAQRPGLVGSGKTDYFFNFLTESYFNTDNKQSYMKTRNPMFLTVGYIVCGLVLFIACFNFINLFLLSWQNRRKEIGIKKILGVTRQGLFNFSLAEAGVYIFTSFLLSMIITFYIIPVFNNVFEVNLSRGYFLNIKVIALLCIVLFITGSLVVIMSVLKQWSMKPISLMTKDSSKVRFSRLLFTIQFAISITLAICSVTIVQQMDFLENAPLGFNRDIVQIDAPDKRYAHALTVVKHKIMQLPDVKNATISNGNPIFGNSIVRYDLGNDQFYTPYLFGGDEDYLKTLDLKLIEGELPSERNNGKLVNQTLVRQFNLDKPVGEKVPGTKEDVIIGVVEDFTCGSFKQEIPPAIISFHNEGQALLIDFRGVDLAKILPQIQKEWKSAFPDYMFTYRIIQDQLMRKYKEDAFFYKIVITFSVISMILSCFGLFALSWAVVQSRTKEMGIRKVLGATSLDILNLLTLTFTTGILLAFLIAAPVGYYLMSEWLTRFVNRIEINVWIFIIAGLMVTIIALFTLSLQTVRAAMTNPVDELRNE